MNRIAELLKRKKQDVERRKNIGIGGVPDDDRRVFWGPDRFRIIAEIKRSSLSAGAIRSVPDVVTIARSYERAGASAISILTEEHYFGGSLEDLRRARGAVRVPVLQKDFIIDEFQILEAKKDGADFVLLIARFLTPEQMESMAHLCEQYGLNAIVEITDEKDLSKIRFPVRYLGVNSRDLETLKVDPFRFERIRPLLPDACLIAESGINSIQVLQKVIALGYNGALIGEHLLRADDPAQRLEEFVRSAGLSETGRRKRDTKVKICGITSERDARMAIEAGASALGFIFAESPRSITLETLQSFRDRISVPCVGVFRGNSPAQIESIIRQCSLDLAQVYDHHPLPSVPTWRARTISSMQEIPQPQDARRNVLLDFKLPDAQMSEAWTMMKGRDLFALAGGLHPENVSEAIRICAPEWVDVARGVEKEPGVKDAGKLRAFLKAVKE